MKEGYRDASISSPKKEEIGEEETAPVCAKGGLDWILEKNVTERVVGHWNGGYPGSGGVTVPSVLKTSRCSTQVLGLELDLAVLACLFDSFIFRFPT